MQLQILLIAILILNRRSKYNLEIQIELHLYLKSQIVNLFNILQTRTAIMREYAGNVVFLPSSL